MWESVDSSFGKEGGERSCTWGRVLGPSGPAGTGRRGEGKGEETLASLPRLPHPRPTPTPSGGGGSGGAGQPRGCRQQLQQPAPPPRSRLPGRARARSAAGGAAAGGDGKVAGASASADMPGSDTALTVDRTYSDPGRHHRCKTRVRGAGGAAVGAPGRGGEAGWALAPVLANSCSPPLAACLSPSPASTGPRRRGWEGGASEPGSWAEQSPARRTSPSAAARSPRACRTRVPGVLDGPRSATLRQGAPAARCPDARESRQARPVWDCALALLTSRAARASSALGVSGAGRRRRTGVPVSRGGCPGSARAKSQPWRCSPGVPSRAERAPSPLFAV